MAAELGFRVHCRSAPVELVQRHGYSPGYTIDPLHVVQTRHLHERGRRRRHAVPVGDRPTPF
jgi:hypothetical protein